MLLKCLADATAASADAVAGDAVGGDGDDCGFVVVALGLFAAKNTGNKFTNHVLPFSERLWRCRKRRILPQTDDFPAHFAAVLAQLVVRINRNRNIYFAHQGQVIV